MAIKVKREMNAASAAAATLAAALQLAAIAAIAAVPTEWQVRVGPKATVYQAERYHGDALALRATLMSGGLPLDYQGAARLYAQTNGMGAVWWDLADVTVSGNVLSATWLPEFDTGADVVDVFLGAPSNYQAHARIRFLPSPGPVPNALPLPTPVLDFAAVEIQNLAALTNGWSFGGEPGNYASVSNAAMSAAAATNDFLRNSGQAVMHGTILFPYFNNYGVKVGADHPGALGFTSTFPEYQDLSATLDLTRIPTDAAGFGYADIAFISDIPAPSVPSAPEVTTALRWRADGTACVVTVAAGGTLTADTSNWTEGQAVMAIITLAEGAGIEQGIELVGYGAWPVGTPFVACCYRIGLTVFVVPSTTL